MWKYPSQISGLILFGVICQRRFYFCIFIQLQNFRISLYPTVTKQSFILKGVLFRKTIIPLLFLGIPFINSGCDSTTGSNSPISDTPAVRSISLTPSEINFTREIDALTDTTVTITVTSEVEHVIQGYAPLFVITDQLTGRVITTQPMINDAGNTYSNSYGLETTTATTTSYLVKVYAVDESGTGNYASAIFDVNGFENRKPELVSTSSPDTIYRPVAGSVPATFTATVSDPDGDETINNVYLRIIDQSIGEVTGSPFLMSDDGSSLGDVTAGDLTFTWELPVTTTTGTQNRDYNIEFYALDNLGLSSDTVKTTFRIREAQ